MRYMQKKSWIALSGFIWSAAGFMLLYRGLDFLSQMENLNVASWLIALGLFAGFIKGRFVLSKTVDRTVRRIYQLSSPIRFTHVYPKGYWMLIASMMGLGFLLRLVPIHWRGLIDTAVGSALLNGAILSFRAAWGDQKADLDES